MTWSVRVFFAGLVSAAASALWLPLDSVFFYLVGQVLGVGTSIVFLLRRRERRAAADLGFALAVVAVAVPDMFVLVVSQLGVD